MRTKRPKEAVCQSCGKDNRDGKLVHFVEDGTLYCHSCGHTEKIDSTKKVRVKKNTEFVPVPYKSIAAYFMRQTLSKPNILITYLSKIFDPELVALYRDEFNIGTSDRGESIFWFLDYEGHVKNGKCVKYGLDGHRQKEFLPRFLYKKENGYGQFLYGLHRMNRYDSTEPINLVESEKTAFIATIAYPTSLWMATGGSKGLTREKIYPIRKRKVIIWVDSDDAGREAVPKMCERLREFNCPYEIKDLEPSRNDGSDIADFIIEKQ